jgi:hypothetical protein
MYGWIWRHLPGGRPGKLLGSAVLLAAAVLALWFVVFPVVEDKMPFNDVTIEQEESPGPARGLAGAEKPPAGGPRSS